MLVPAKNLSILMNYRFLSYFMPGQAENYFAEAIKRHFNARQTDHPIGVSYERLGGHKITIGTKWAGTHERSMLLEFDHSIDKYFGDAKGDVRLPIYNFSIGFEEVALGQLQVRGLSFSDTAVSLFDRYVRKNHDPRKDEISDQIIYALLLSSLSYTKGLQGDHDQMQEFLGKGLVEGLNSLAEIVRKTKGLKYSEVFYDEGRIEDQKDGPLYYILRPQVLWAIDQAVSAYKKRHNAEHVAQIDFLRVPQQMGTVLGMDLERPKLPRLPKPGPK